MKKILVSLIGDQTIPNILAVQRFKPDELLFISTPVMEGKRKTLSILNALEGMGMDFKGRCHTVSVMEDSIMDCHRELEAWMTGREDGEYLVNLTGGTKIMSIAAYEFFKDYGARMIYIPISKNEFITPFPKRHTQTEELTTRLKVADYLAAYGLSIKNGPKLSDMMEEAVQRKELSEWMVLNYQDIKNLLEWLCGALREPRNKKRKHFELKGEFAVAGARERELLLRLGFIVTDGKLEKTLNRSEILYLTGGWLEEYCFNVVSEFVGRGVDDVAIGMKIVNEKGNENEFDVMFTRENALYTIECKSLDQNTDKGTDALYKIAALNKDFGLKVESFFVSTSPYIMKDGKIIPAVDARAGQFNTHVVTPDKVSDFPAILSRELKINALRGCAGV